MIIKAIRLIVLCASMFGYMRYFSRKIAPELSIGFTFVSIGSVMFVAGLLNVLPETAILVCLGGLVCLAWTLVKEKRKLTLSLGGAFFLMMCAILVARLWGCHFIHLDNFTHWGLAVRHMLTKDRFPNFTDSYIRFQSYPLGAGALIYYFAKISGIHAEWFQMLAHWACAAAMFAGFLGLAKNTPAKVLGFIGPMLLLCVDNNFDQLLVDSALAFVGLGAASFCVYYGRELKQKGFYVIPWLTFLITVKNSGALFVLFVVFLVFLWGGWKKGLAALVAPFAFLLLWNRHVAYVYESGMMAQHSMSIDNFKRMLMNKRAGSVRTIITKMAQEVFSLANPYLAVFLLSLAACVLVWVLLKKERTVRTLLIYGVVCYLLYQVGMTGMYIFTMSEKEAVRLASYPRYHGTILIFSTGVMVMAMLLLSERIRDIKNGRKWTTACCAACALAIVVSGMPKYSQYFRTNNEEAVTRAEYRQTLETLVSGYGVEPEAKYYVLIDQDSKDMGFIYNMINCLMLADDVQVRKLDQIYSNEEIDACDYMLGFGKDKEIGAYIFDTYGTRDRVINLKEAERIPGADGSGGQAEAEDAGDEAGAGPINLREALMGNGQ